MGLHKIIYETGDGSQGATVGAFVISKGTEIDHKTIDSQEWLNTAAALHDSAGNGITSTAGALDVNLKSPITIDVSLDYTNDSVTAYQGGTWTIDSITNPVTVQATDLDIRDLVAATDSVSSWTKDGSGNSIGSHTGALDVYMTNSLTVNDAALANTAIKAKANGLDTADTAEDVVAVADVLANRKYLFIYNEGKNDVYIGESGVTVANGYPVPQGSEMILRLGAAVDVEFIGVLGGTGANGKAKIRTLQLS